jgi:hypothetical protein
LLDEVRFASNYSELKFRGRTTLRPWWLGPPQAIRWSQKNKFLKILKIYFIKCSLKINFCPTSIKKKNKTKQNKKKKQNKKQKKKNPPPK